MPEELSSQDISSSSKKRWFVLGIIGVLALATLFGIYSFVYSSFGDVGTFQESVNAEMPIENPDVNVNIKADIEAVSNCGSLDCFKGKFANCEKAQVTYTLLDNLVYYYEILGPDGNACNVKSKFIKNPNPSWVGKEMTCNYDNSLDFNEAVKDMSQCHGELYNLMTGS